MTLKVSSVTLTRPADTNAYSAKDAISNSTSAPTVLTFSNAVMLGRDGFLVKARLMTDQSTFTAKLRLHLYTVAPTPINDNAAFTMLFANADKRIGYIDFPAAATEGSGSDAAASILVAGQSNLVLAIHSADQEDDIYGLLEVIDAFTPASGQKFFIELTTEY